ncbi:MAG: fibronectin type III domain-containing protein [Oscillospiraceae bacterium]|nr:fibronectin type III domain-containing protein [Oscillospiraceae bacterium]
MSDFKLVSPLLDGYVMGDPMSSHDGVYCCPAMKENSDEKYIVKIISVPASQKQLDALLLTGAFSDAGAAMEYFKELTNGIVKEAETLQQLSKLEGFLPYDGWQVVPMVNGELGYNVYLVGSYKRSLEKHLRRNPMTHLGAVNLGLDLCAALAICRRAGYMFIDLKPSNIYLTGDREYRIGDLGFVNLQSLKYTSMPSKYRSPYTAPELHDALATLNPTADVYSLGMILYQLYNNGQLPFQDRAPKEELPAPLNADYEMAEIIMKAITPDPRSRWQNPIEMGKALVGYMQRNTVNDNPIVPPKVEQSAPITYEEPEIEEAEDLLTGNPAAVFEEIASPEPIAEEAGLIAEDPLPAEEEDLPAEPEEEVYDPPYEFRDDDFIPDDDDIPEVDPTDEAAEEGEENTDSADEVPEYSYTAELDFLKDMVSDETAPDVEAGDDLSDAEMTDEVNSMLSQADDLLSQDVPGGVVIPDPIEITIPVDFDEEKTAIAEEPEDDEDEEFHFRTADVDDDDAEDREENRNKTDADGDHEIEVLYTRPRKKGGRSWLAVIAIVLVLALAGFGGFYFYTNYYLLTIDKMTIDEVDDTLTVQVVTDVDEALLTAVCTDTYGNTFSVPVIGGKAVFTELNASTTYKITLEASGFHALSGSYTGSYTTKEETNIVSFTAITGADDGTVILNFTVEGRDTQEWIVEYSAEGEEPRSESFTGHMVTINGLSVGKTYTFTLVSPEESGLYITGSSTLEFTASRIITAENLSIVSCEDGVLTAQWDAPSDAAVESWTVRCYSDDGYDETVTVSETTAQFTDISADTAYTLEVTAAGMAQSARAYVTANPTTVSNLGVKSDGLDLNVTWEHAGEAPEGGWLLMYRIDGSDHQEVVTTTSNSAVISRFVPGAAYSIVLKAADGSTVFGGELEYAAEEAGEFDDHSLKASEIQVSLCRTPDVDDWTHETLDSDTDYTTKFTSTQSASLVLYATKNPGNSKEETVVMFVLRDADGNVIGELVNTETYEWASMWKDRYAYLTIPELPAELGSYTVEVYFNNALVVNKTLNITG